MPENKKVKYNVKINGTNFNKAAVAEMTKEEFVKMHMAVDEVFPGAKDKEKMLSDAYALLTAKKEKAVDLEKK